MDCKKKKNNKKGLLTLSLQIYQKCTKNKDKKLTQNKGEKKNIEYEKKKKKLS